MKKAQTKVTVIGLGLMGTALAQTLSETNLDVTVWNRSLDKAQTLACVTVASSIVEAVHASEIIILCVSDYDVTNTLLQSEEVESALAGKVIIQLSTGTPSQARAASCWAASISALYLDGAIMAFPDAIGTSSCTILYAGERNCFDSCRAVIDVFGGTARLVGSDPGSAATLDTAILSIYFSFLFGTLNGAAICDAENVSLALFREMSTLMLPAIGDVLSRSIDMISADNYESQRSTLNTSVGALSQIAAVGHSVGLDPRYIECMKSYAIEAMAAGDGALNNAVLFKQFCKQASLAN